ncbi:MAG: DUF1566 domain-containing protein [Bacteroidaceae bacterium]|nr:DUF1566 domain-containing protein [Bacteroidaceae bacterium]
MKQITIKSVFMRLIAVILLSIGTLSASAQYYMNIHQKNGGVYKYVVANIDSVSFTEKQANPADTSAVVPDTLAEGGLYLGVIGFHRSFYMQPISILNSSTINTFKSFISRMTSENGTLLYYSVDQALDALNNVVVPERLTNVAMITFTDGIDQGSNTHLWQEHNYEDEWLYDPNEDYLTAIQKRILSDSVGGVPVTSYSIGLKGDQEDLNTVRFRSDIKKLASADSLGVVVDSIKEVNENFQRIAEKLNSKYNYQNIPITIPGLSTGDRVRIAFDIRKADADVTSQDAVSSRLYIEGTYNLRKQLLTDVVYEGLTSLSGDTIYGELDEYGHSKFLFEKVLTNDNKLIVAENIKEFYLVKDGLNNYWQKNREFEHPADEDIVIEKSSAIIMLILDCSSSLIDEDKKIEETDFYRAKKHAISFIETLYKSYNSTSTGGDDNNNNNSPYEYVDLGLSVKWATYNVGATKPEEYGDYFAWGETETKSSYSWRSYKFRTSGDSYSNVKFNKYNTSSSYGTVDNKTTLDAADDVAHIKWGGSWRMPTTFEQDELRDYCTWTWTTLNGVNGYRVTSNMSGYTDRSIFLPAAGYRYDTYFDYAGSCGYYWSSSLYTDYPYSAWSVDFGSSGVNAYISSRYLGFSVRPVCP